MRTLGYYVVLVLPMPLRASTLFSPLVALLKSYTVMPSTSRRCTRPIVSELIPSVCLEQIKCLSTRKLLILFGLYDHCSTRQGQQPLLSIFTEFRHAPLIQPCIEEHSHTVYPLLLLPWQDRTVRQAWSPYLCIQRVTSSSAISVLGTRKIFPS